jgi:hypothetical protein
LEFDHDGPPIGVLHDLNRALTLARDCHRLVRKSSRPRAGLERDARQRVGVPQIADLAAIEIYELSTTGAAAAPQRSYCTTFPLPLIQLVPEKIVLSLGYNVSTFGSAEEFLKSGQVHDKSCLVTDLQMPGLSGIDL